jgi:hypothetical protein
MVKGETSCCGTAPAQTPAPAAVFVI